MKEPATNPARPLWRVLIVWCAVGLALRLLMLIASGEPALQKDESGYIYLALAWQRFGFLMDAERYQWPPAWIFVLKSCFEVFGRDGLLAAKLFQCLASVGIGVGVIGGAFRLGGARAAKLAGIGWAFYLPMAAFTHMLWAEPMFLGLLAPAVWLLIGQEQCRQSGAANRKLLVAGLVFGLAMLVKESAIFLAPLLACGIGCSWLRERPIEGLRRASLFLLAVGAVLLPWTLRNLDVYGGFAPSGISMGENAYHGLNSRYVNFDLSPLARLPRAGGSLEGLSREWFVQTDPAGVWGRAGDEPNTALRSSTQMDRGLAWSRNHPAEFARTRVKKLADLVLPSCFLIRHQALGIYEGAMGSEWARRLLVLWAVVATMGLLILSVPAAVHAALRLRRLPGLWVPCLCALYFLSTSALVSMSRFRLSLVPWLLMLVAVFLADRSKEAAMPRKGKVVSGLGLGVLFFLWWVDLPEFLKILELAWTR